MLIKRNQKFTQTFFWVPMRAQLKSVASMVAESQKLIQSSKYFLSKTNYKHTLFCITCLEAGNEFKMFHAQR